jgi:hypothetical protein
MHAFGNSRIAEHTRKVMIENYLSKHYAQRWTDYLIDVHRQPERTRILLFYPADLLGSLAEWVATLAVSCPDCDLCGLPIHGATERLSMAAAQSVYANYGCPVFYSFREQHLEDLVTYARPDVLLTFPGLAGRELLPERLAVPIVVAQPDPSTCRAWRQGLNPFHGIKDLSALE